MKIRLLSVLSALLLGLSAFTFFRLQDWKTTETFTVRFICPDVAGLMTRFRADISFDEKNPAAAKFDVHVEAGSVSTGNTAMDEQAMGASLLEAGKYPEITFQSTGATKTSDGFLTTGILSLHGMKKEISIPFTFDKNVFKGGFAFKCRDYQMNGLGTGEADVLRIELVVPVVQK